MMACARFSDASTPCARRVAMISLAEASGDTGKNFGCKVNGTCKKADQRASSARRYAWRCGARLASGRPPDTLKTLPRSKGRTSICAPVFAAMAIRRA